MSNETLLKATLEKIRTATKEIGSAMGDIIQIEDKSSRAEAALDVRDELRTMIKDLQAVENNMVDECLLFGKVTYGKEANS